MFRYIHYQEFPTGFQLNDLPYLKLAKSYGFDFLSLDDITRNCLPTIKIVHQTLKRYIKPVVAFENRYLSRPWATSLFPAHRKRMNELFSYYELRTDPSYFMKHIRYAILLLKDDRA